MRVRKEQIEYAKRATVVAVVKHIAEVRKIATEEAFAWFSSTKTFDLLQSSKSRLYLESTEYVLDMLNDEVKGDWDSWLKV